VKAAGGPARASPRETRAARVAVPEMRDDVLWFVDATFSAWNWAHKSMRDSVTHLSVEEATWQPSRTTHAVWRQINHVAHWKAYIVARIRGLHPRARQAWPASGRTAGDLRRSIAALTRLHRDLRRAVLRLEPDAFVRAKRGRYSIVQLLLGAAAHESYHAGQILLTRKLYRSARGRR
jgi:uncharacterized damage-inducible protein DinB